MFVKRVTVTDSNQNTTTTATPNWVAIGVAVVFLVFILAAAFEAQILGFTGLVTPLMTAFTTGSGGVFGATVGESISK